MENYTKEQQEIVEREGRKVFFIVAILAVIFVLAHAYHLKQEERQQVQNKPQTQVTQTATPVSTVTQMITERTQQSQYEDTIKKQAKEQGLNPVSALAAYMSARNYIINLGGFSTKMLYRQLTYEGFTEDETIFAMSWLEALKQVDYNEQAYLSARRYMELFSMSQKQLHNQLVFEGFTDEQIIYAIARIYKN